MRIGRDMAIHCLPAVVDATFIDLTPLFLLAAVARNLGTSIEELIGEEGSTTTRKRGGPEPKLARQIEQVRQLPRSQQQFVSQMIDTVLQQQRGQETARKTGS